MSLPLRISDLKVTAGARNRVLIDLPRLALQSGQSLGISGPSGAGKSTLLYAIAGLSEHCSGEVRWGNTDFLALRSGARAAFRAAHIGMVFQDFLLFDEMSADANAAIAACFAPKPARAGLRARAETSLARLGLTDTARSVASFSGGERQRVAIARALAGDPAILLADEPTASLDRDAADRVIEDLSSAAREQGTTLVTVSHDQALLARMDRVLHLENGRPVGTETERAA